MKTAKQKKLSYFVLLHLNEKTVHEASAELRVQCVFQMQD